MVLRLLEKATFGFRQDGFDLVESYQMVPLDGERTLIMQTDSGPCALTIRNPATTRVSDFRFMGVDTPVPGLPAGRFSSATLPANSLMSFTVHGEGFGMTNIHIAEQSANPAAITIELDITVSVKRPLTVRYATVFLSDIFRGDVSGQLNPDSVLPAVQQVFKRQANVDVISTGRREFVFVRADLGDPILLFIPEVLDQIEKATPAKTWIGVDFVVFCCWDFDAARGQLAALANRRFSNPERVFIFMKHLQDSDTLARAFAHEIGHTFFLGHVNIDALMFGTTAGRSTRLSPPEIEVVNPPPRGRIII